MVGQSQSCRRSVPARWEGVPGVGSRNTQIQGQPPIFDQSVHACHIVIRSASAYCEHKCTHTIISINSSSSTDNIHRTACILLAAQQEARSRCSALTRTRTWCHVQSPHLHTRIQDRKSTRLNSSH